MNIIDTIASQYANSPALLKIIYSFADAIDPNKFTQEYFDLIFNIATANDYGLDNWGRIIGISRHVKGVNLNAESFGFSQGYFPFNNRPFSSGGPGSAGGWELDTEAYRKLLFLKALANIIYATAPNINKLIREFFGRDCYYLITGHMQAEYVFKFELGQFERFLVFDSGILPRPCGVHVDISVDPPIPPAPLLMAYYPLITDLDDTKGGAPLTFSRASNKLFFDYSADLMQFAGEDTPAFQPLGLWVEAAETSRVLNAFNIGATPPWDIGFGTGAAGTETATRFSSPLPTGQASDVKMFRNEAGGSTVAAIKQDNINLTANLSCVFGIFLRPEDNSYSFGLWLDHSSTTSRCRYSFDFATDTSTMVTVDPQFSNTSVVAQQLSNGWWWLRMFFTRNASTSAGRYWLRTNTGAAWMDVWCPYLQESQSSPILSGASPVTRARDIPVTVIPLSPSNCIYFEVKIDKLTAARSCLLHWYSIGVGEYFIAIAGANILIGSNLDYETISFPIVAGDSIKILKRPDKIFIKKNSDAVSDFSTSKPHPNHLVRLCATARPPDANYGGVSGMLKHVKFTEELDVTFEEIEAAT